jgi:pimeloyl-ACP methyl ester carboxylesterase
MMIRSLPPGRAMAGRGNLVTPWRLAALAGLAGAVALAAATLVAPTAAATTGWWPYPPATVRWQACPQYSDAVLAYLGYPTSQKQSQFRALWARTRCGTVQVPLDYSDPGGTQITIAITVLKAADPAHRLGTMIMNPGGPGGSGYLMPIGLAMPGQPSTALNQRYDLVGFDPRGVGYSTQINCSPPSIGSGAQPPVLTRAYALQMYDQQVAYNQVCARTDPAFLSQLTTANVARDMNQIRIALHQRKIGYLGVSWGTALGAVYRSLFPGTVSRMWLDSVMDPDWRFDQVENTDAAASETDFTRLCAWIAARNATYRFGATAAQVKAALVRLENSYNAHPRKFTGLATEVSGSVVAESATQNSQYWALSAEVLKELRDAKGTTLPPAVKFVLVKPPPPPIPAGAPQQQNQTAYQALNCNVDTGNRSFGASWAAYQQRLRVFPVTGEMSPPAVQTECAQWPFPARPWPLRRVSGSLEMSGHRYETTTAYQWTLQMQSLIGGKVFTDDDDIHGSAMYVASCASQVIAYFDTGRTQTRQCPGFPVPTSTAVPPGA